MRYLKGEEESEAVEYMEETAQIATSSCCLRARCGTVIVNGGKIIGLGFNSPPGNVQLDRCLKDDLPKDFKSDKTCCLHAEERAITDALIKDPGKLRGSRLYFMRLDKEGKKEIAGDPYCTICSKLVLDVGIKEFVLLQKNGICVYDTKEYNDLSFQYREKGP